MMDEKPLNTLTARELGIIADTRLALTALADALLNQQDTINGNEAGCILKPIADRFAEMCDSRDFEAEE